MKQNFTSILTAKSYLYSIICAGKLLKLTEKAKIFVDQNQIYRSSEMSTWKISYESVTQNARVGCIYDRASVIVLSAILSSWLFLLM